MINQYTRVQPRLSNNTSWQIIIIQQPRMAGFPLQIQLPVVFFSL